MEKRERERGEGGGREEEKKHTIRRRLTLVFAVYMLIDIDPA